jgi:hypothetical protein
MAARFSDTRKAEWNEIEASDLKYWPGRAPHNLLSIMLSTFPLFVP